MGKTRAAAIIEGGKPIERYLDAAWSGHWTQVRTNMDLGEAVPISCTSTAIRAPERGA